VKDAQQLLNQNGQMTVEMVLLAVVLVSIMVGFQNYAVKNGFATSFMEGPWSVVRGMAENGVWMHYKDANTFHPSHKMRHGSEEGTQTDYGK
jgi:hypothetical protein